MGLQTSSRKPAAIAFLWKIRGTLIKRHRMPKPECMGGGLYTYDDLRLAVCFAGSLLCRSINSHHKYQPHDCAGSDAPSAFILNSSALLLAISLILSISASAEDGKSPVIGVTSFGVLRFTRDFYLNGLGVELEQDQEPIMSVGECSDSPPSQLTPSSTQQQESHCKR